MPDLVELVVTAYRELRRVKSDAFLSVWSLLFELAPGATTTIPELLAALRSRGVNPRTAFKALARAREAKLVEREDLRTASGAIRWKRSTSWPRAAEKEASGETTTLETLLFTGATRSAALSVLDALVRSGHLELTPRGYEVRPL